MLSILHQTSEGPAHERYLFKPLRGSSHVWALEQLSNVVSERKVLDIGAGSGWLGRALKPARPAELAAVEIDTRSHGELLKSYDRVLTDIAALRGETFDLIVLLDVLEHLPKPAEYLKEVRSLLSPEGHILVSVPNVAHWSVRFPLFFLGRFEYRSLGIMDGTHLHFFSRRGFMNLCNSVPMSRIEQVSASIEPFELALPRWLWDNPLYRALLPARHSIARALPGLMAYQHLALLRATE
jgi:SAM-dependent methyltransferase